jgi:hypothetical protein
MAFTYPLDRDTFLGTIPVWELTFDLTENVEVAGLADGSLLRDEIGPRLWRGRCKIDLMTFAQAPRVEAMISLLQRSGTSFLAWRLDRAYPQGDPDGTILGAATPTIASLPASGVELTITGLPVGYQIAAGDMLSFAYGASPTRYALHRVITGAVVADAAGTTPAIEVEPPIRTGAVTGAAVELARPYCKAMLLPGSVTPGTVRRNKVRGLSFDFIQTLR